MDSNTFRWPFLQKYSMLRWLLSVGLVLGALNFLLTKRCEYLIQSNNRMPNTIKEKSCTVSFSQNVYSKNYLELIDEKPLCVQTKWNYFPSIPKVEEPHFETTDCTQGLHIRELFSEKINLVNVVKPLCLPHPIKAKTKIFSRLIADLGQESYALLAQTKKKESVRLKWLNANKLIKLCSSDRPEMEAWPENCFQVQLWVWTTEVGDPIFFWETATSNETLNLWVERQVFNETTHLKLPSGLCRVKVNF